MKTNKNLKNDLKTSIKSKFNTKKYSDAAKGKYFEKLVTYFLQEDKEQKQRWKKIYSYRKFAAWYNDHSPTRTAKIPPTDQGIDLVAVTFDQKYFAFQCKYYDDDRQIIYREKINSFRDAVGSHNVWSGGILVTTSSRWSCNLVETTTLTDRYEFYIWDLLTLNKTSILWHPLIFYNRIEQQKVPPLFDHQKVAVQKVIRGFSTNKRGQLIMACGTGKTRVALTIAEALIKTIKEHRVRILVVVPSINLVGQLLNEFNNNAQVPFESFVVCSDTTAGEYSIVAAADILRMPAAVLKTGHRVSAELTGDNPHKQPVIIFSTYHSLPKIHQAQYSTTVSPTPVANFKFDLIVCDEAHRTTSYQRRTTDKQLFAMIHRDEQICGERRLYMTATPKIYKIKDDIRQAKLAKDEIEVISMDNEAIFGPQFYKYSFKQAIEDKQLVNYRMIIMVRDENSFRPADMQKLQNLFKTKFKVKVEPSKQITYLTKLLGLFEVVAGAVANKHGTQPFRSLNKIICFNSNLGRRTATKKSSNDQWSSPGSRHNQFFAAQIQDYAAQINPRFKHHTWSWQHIEAKTPSDQRQASLTWLAKTSAANETRVISNVRCLGEGVDVPALDGVVFLDPRQSTIDIIQAIGRVMRRAEGKTEGYVVLPIVCNPQTLNHNVREDDPALQRQNQQWLSIIKVINALAAHDERLSDQLMEFKINPDYSKKINRSIINDVIHIVGPVQPNFPFARVDVKIRAIIALAGPRARSQPEYMKYIGTIAKDIKNQFNARNRQYQEEVQQLTTAISNYWKTECSFQDALTLTIQHLIIQPCLKRVFVTLDCMRHNPVVRALNNMVTNFRTFLIKKINNDKVWDYFLLFLDQQTQQIRTITNVVKQDEQRQTFLINFFNDFWKFGFPAEQKKYGIVYTPLPVIKWMVAGLDFLIKTKLNLPAGIKNQQVKIIDPFAGTGSFLTYICEQYAGQNVADFIKNKIFAVEIQPVAYYWTWIRLLTLAAKSQHSNFDLTDHLLWADTLKLKVHFQNTKNDFDFWPQLNRTKNHFLTTLKTTNIIISNPPYSQIFGANKGFKQLYPDVADFIKQHWSKNPAYKFNASKMYNLATFALAWTVQLLTHSSCNAGIIAFICPNTFFKGKGGPAIRAHLNHHFTDIYALDLHGNFYDLQLQGVKTEGQNIFGNRSTTGIHIIFLIWKQKLSYHQPGLVNYCDVNRFLPAQNLTTSAKEKFLNNYSLTKLINDHQFQALTLNQEGGWLGKLVNYNYFWKLNTVFKNYLGGFRGGGNNKILFNFDKDQLIENVTRLKHNYEAIKQNQSASHDKTKLLKSFGMTKKLIGQLARNQTAEPVDSQKVTLIHKTPFVIKHVYFSDFYAERAASINPFNSKQKWSTLNLVIPSKSFGANFTVFCLDHRRYPFEAMYFHCVNLYPLYTSCSQYNQLLDQQQPQCNLTDEFISFMQYSHQRISARTIFWYIYGLLWSNDYRVQLKTFFQTHKPAICKVKDYQVFQQLSSVGEKLGTLHSNWEAITIDQIAHYGADLNLTQDCYEVKEITFFKPKRSRSFSDQTQIIFNEHVQLKDIPPEAYFLKFDGVSAVKHFMNEHKYRYDSKLNITDDPNQFMLVQNNPRYLLETLLKIIHVSVKTYQLVQSLPKINLKSKTLISKS